MDRRIYEILRIDQCRYVAVSEQQSQIVDLVPRQNYHPASNTALLHLTRSKMQANNVESIRSHLFVVKTVYRILINRALWKLAVETKMKRARLLAEMPLVLLP